LESETSRFIFQKTGSFFHGRDFKSFSLAEAFQKIKLHGVKAIFSNVATFIAPGLSLTILYREVNLSISTRYLKAA